MVIRLFIVVLLLASLPTVSLAENSCNDVIDTSHFPNGLDMTVCERTKKRLEQFKQKAHEVKNSTAELWAEKHNNGEFEQHDWKTLGRMPGYSAIDWMTDSFNAIGPVGLGLDTDVPGPDTSEVSFNTFQECFKPTLVLPFCYYCQPWIVYPEDCDTPEINQGYVWEYWWPEYTVELNKFGVSAINPIQFARPDLIHTALALQAKTLMSLQTPTHLASLMPQVTGDLPGGINDVFSYYQEPFDQPSELWWHPHVGNTHLSSMSPLDPQEHTEAHAYRTKALSAHAPEQNDKEAGEWGFYYIKVYNVCVPLNFWYNGYKKGNRECFYGTLEDKVSKMDSIVFSEEREFLPTWRIPTKSKDVNKRLYEASVPSFWRTFSDLHRGNNVLFQLDRQFAQTDSCAALRVEKYSDRYGDLPTALSASFEVSTDKRAALEEICYRGGGQLYPLTGTMSGGWRSPVSGAYAARRAIELFSHKYSGNRAARRLNKFLDNPERMDKLQMVYPKVSQCFTMDQVDELNDGLFTPENDLPSTKGSRRYIYWNKRRACTCQYRSVYEDGDWAGVPFLERNGWGCQLYGDKEEAKGDKTHGGMDGFLHVPYGWMGTYGEAAGQLYPFMGAGV